MIPGEENTEDDEGGEHRLNGWSEARLQTQQTLDGRLIVTAGMCGSKGHDCAILPRPRAGASIYCYCCARHNWSLMVIAHWTGQAHELDLVRVFSGRSGKLDYLALLVV
jgi:hypothetical protein